MPGGQVGQGQGGAGGTESAGGAAGSAGIPGGAGDSRTGSTGGGSENGAGGQPGSGVAGSGDVFGEGGGAGGGQSTGSVAGRADGAGSGSGSGDEFGGLGRAAGTGTGAGDDPFDRALGDFDRVIESEQGTVAQRGGDAAADDTGQQVGRTGGLPGAGSNGDESGADSGGVAPPRDLGPDNRTVQSVEGCDDQDTIARQLCEAATQEEDPFLRAALWDEYNEYKRILGRL